MVSAVLPLQGTYMAEVETLKQHTIKMEDRRWFLDGFLLSKSDGLGLDGLKGGGGKG